MQPSYTQLGVVFISMLALDAIFIGANRASYDRAAIAIQGSRIRVDVRGAALTYACMYALFVLFALPEVNKKRGFTRFSDRLAMCARYAGLLGLLTYGIYDFTTKAVLSAYPWSVAFADTVWGGVLFTLLALIASYI